jgi:DNA repair protein RecO (recombination protein O)
VPPLTDDAFVLRHWDFSETSQTVALFCRSHGVLRGLAKGSRRERANFSGGFESLDKGQIVAILKASTELATLTEWDLRRRPIIVSRSLPAHYAALYWADLVYHLCTDSDPHTRLFDALDESLLALDRAEPPAGLTLRFQWSALEETGHKPDLRPPPGAAPAARTLGFDPRLGRLVPDPGRTTAADTAVWRARRATVDLLRTLDGDPPNGGTGLPARASPTLSPEPADLDRANRFLAALIRWFLGRETPTMAALFGPRGFGSQRPPRREATRRPGR